MTIMSLLNFTSLRFLLKIGKLEKFFLVVFFWHTGRGLEDPGHFIPLKVAGIQFTVSPLHYSL
jgi:hypothetical protein